ncbi:MAG: glutathione S-transferase [Deltaproteobacteria bacterium]|nr:glutathione S-transferase [Deltaproteobacteria bacterium]
MSAELVGLALSPYTEKAKWALDHHGVSYRYHEHLVMLGMPALRLKARRLTGDVTVPLLIVNKGRDGTSRYYDSLDIARFADAQGSSSAKLFPPGRDGEIAAINALSEEGLDAGREATLPRLFESRDARVENLPPFIPGPLAGVSTPLVGLGLRYLMKEFNVERGAGNRGVERLRGVLAELRRHLASKSYLLDAFSYADIVGTLVLQFVKPLGKPYFPLGPATQRCMTNDELALEFSDLVRWRDQVYEKHRSGAKPSH